MKPSTPKKYLETGLWYFSQSWKQMKLTLVTWLHALIWCFDIKVNMISVVRITSPWRQPPPLEAGVIVCYIVVTRQLPLQPALTQSARYFPWWDLSSSSPFSSCAPNIAHLFVYVVGNCSKSKPGLLPLVLVAGLSAATTCQLPF